MLISDKFEGAVVGPLCLYLDAKPGEDNEAQACLDKVPGSFLMKVACTDYADIHLIGTYKVIPAKTYRISGPLDKRMDVHQDFDGYVICTLSFVR